MKSQEAEDWKDRMIELSAAQFLWDLEDDWVAAGDLTLTFTWRGDWASHSGPFLISRRLMRHCVTVSWRHGRPPTRPNKDLVWDGERWRPRLAPSEDQEVAR